MNLLAVETSEISGSVAVWRNGYLETEHFLGSAQRSAQSLAPAIRSVLTAAGLTPRDISCVAATVGPGSFTGLRVGVMTAKMFAYAVGASVAAVDTLLAIATGCNVPDFFEKTVSIAIDAQRKQVVAQSFHLRKSGGLYTKKPPDAPPITSQRKKECGETFLVERRGAYAPRSCAIPLAPARIVGIEEWLSEPVDFFAGPILSKPSVQEIIPESARQLPPEYWHPKASHVGAVALAQADFQSPWTLSPVYSRLSAAQERKSEHKA